MTALGPGKRLSAGWITARRTRRCAGCRAPILIGARYWRVWPVGTYCAPCCESEDK